MEFARTKPVFRAADAIAAGFQYVHLSRSVSEGHLTRVARGVYQLTEPNNVSEHHNLVEAATAVPHGVICLLSALSYYEIGTQVPSEVWIGVALNRWKPDGLPFPVRVVWFSSHYLTSGRETHEIDGVKVPMTSRVRTVVDCFKFRNALGLDVALEALKDGLEKKLFTRTEIGEEARACRQWNVLRPYLESMSI